jgi:imidazolonepropionase-like amidohydrolase|tara:strand:- start:3403 stop:4701 length:1299 start_codon:yes stop_codon:yes gene_type:complete
MSKRLFLLGLFLSLPVYAISPKPADPQVEPVALVGVTAHVGNGEVVSEATVAFANGILTYVGAMADADVKGHRIVEATGQHVYPGFILPASNLGLVEVSALRASVDQRERGSLNPNVRSLVAYNTDSEITPTLRFNGVLLAQITPSGGLVAGQSSIVELDAWNWEDAAYKIDDGMHINWPTHKQFEFNRSTLTVELVDNKNRQQALKAMRGLFDEARGYQTDADVPVNIKLKSMAKLFAGSQQLFIHTNRARDIVDSINFAKGYGIHRLVIIGGLDALQVSDILVKEKVPVILNSIHRLPSASHSGYDDPYRLPARLVAAGVKVGLTITFNISGRNLPFVAGTAAAHGLDPDSALQLITRNNTEILGIADRVGTLAVGKDATLFVSPGDALDMRSNNLTHAFVRGRGIVLKGMQEELHERFREKYTQGGNSE